MDLRVASWNVDGWHMIRDAQLRLLDQSGADLALLQEVTPASLDLLRQAGWRGTSALELIDDNHTERGGARPRFGCAVLARGSVSLGEGSLIDHAPSAVRALTTEVRVGGIEVTAISAALPPGSMWGRAAKLAQADAITKAAVAAGSPVVIGMDRNGPKFERWSPADTEWWPEDPVGFFDQTAAHGCVDVLDRWYASNLDARRQAIGERPNGPRAVSYIEKRANPPIERRYDVIMADTAFEVSDVSYRYRQAIESGSDHGLVEATLSM